MSMMAMMMGGSLPTYAVSLSANRAHWRLSVDGSSIPTDRPVILVITVASNIEVQSTSASFAALHINGLYAGSYLRVINNGYLLGMGGYGGHGGLNASVGFPGGNGGHGIYVTTAVNIFIDNLGYIWGGGGGGGGGGSNSSIVWGGGGGGGAGGGVGGLPGATPGGGSQAGSDGTPTRTGTYGAGGVGSGVNAGGRGGAYGEAGVNGSASGAVLGGNGGVAGYALKYVTGATVAWQTTGNRLGTVGT